MSQEFRLVAGEPQPSVNSGQLRHFEFEKAGRPADFGELEVGCQMDFGRLKAGRPALRTDWSKTHLHSP
jgi:hypothetical protein